MSNRKIINAAATGGIGYYPVVGASDPYYDKVSLLLNGDTDVDTNFANVSLLLTGNDLLDKSNNKATVTAYGNATVTSVKKQFGTGSYYFDGTGDYLDIPNSVALQILNGPFTIECWVNFATITGNHGLIGVHNNSSDGYFIRTIDANNIRYWNSASGAADRAYSFATNTWYHIAVSSDGTNGKMFINGVQQGAAFATAGSTQNTGNTFQIGQTSNNGNYLNGYLDDIRITKGVARYTANFTPPTQALPSHEILDSSVYRLPVTTYGNARIDTATKKYGTGAMYFDGVGDYLAVPNSSVFDIGTGDFTIEAWIYMNSSVNGTICALNKGSGVDGIYFVHGGGIYVTSDSSSWNIISLGTIPGIVSNQWQHVALVRAGSSWVVYLNGINVHSVTSTASVSFTGTRLFGVGATGSGSTPLNGYIDDLRITKGYARYTSDFTPPTTVSGVASGYTPQVSNAPFGVADNLSDTGWILASGGSEYFIYDFGSVVSNIRTISFYSTYAGGGRDRVMQIQTSNDGTNFTNLTTVNYATTGGGVYSYQLPSFSSRYIKVYATNTGGSHTPRTSTVKFYPSFTPPTAALPTIPPTIAADPWWGNVSLLLDGNTTDAYDPYWQNVSLMLTGDDFIDWSNQHNAITNNGTVTLSTSIKKFNASAYDFSITGKYLSIPTSANLSMGTDNFTMELWVYRSGAGLQDRFILDKGNAGSFLFRWQGTTNNLQFFINSGSGATLILEYVNFAFTLSTWYHLAVVRSGTTFTLYVNGVSVATGTSSSSLATVAANVTICANATSGGENFQGYIADLRITKGIARYTANFTVPTAALPAYKIQDRTQNNLTLTPYGNVQLSTDVKKNGTGSMFFDGTSYMTIPANVAFNFGTGDYTVEGWIYATTKTWTLYATGGGGTSDQFSCDNGTLYWEYGTTSGTYLFFTDSDLNKWVHVAASRSSGNLKIFKNGIAVNSITSTTSIGSSSNVLYVGKRTDGYYSFGGGYIDDLRITKGYARYTQNFTPPSQSFATQYISTGFDPNYADVSLLLSGEGTNGSTAFNDLSSSPKTITTYGNAQISTAVKKYGTGSIYFDGSGDYLTVPSSDGFNFGSGNFTIEVWVYASGLGSFNAVFAQWPDDGATSNNSYVMESVGSSMYFYCAASGSVISATLGTITTGSWIYYTICRSGNTLYPFKNGVLGTPVSITQTLNSPTSNVTVGGNVAGSGFWNGYIDDLRITKGIARYTTSFTPPTYALATTTGTAFDVNRADTSLLLRGNGTNGSTSFTDESPNNLTITNNGSVTVNTTTKKYGTGSMAFSGSNYLSIPNSSRLVFGAGDFTVEAWINLTSIPVANVSTIAGVWDASTGYGWIIQTDPSMLRIVTTGLVFTSASWAPATNIWYHIAVSRSSGSIRIFVNGTQIGTTATVTGDIQSTFTLNIGMNRDGGNSSLPFNGYVDDLRITKGYARYTANFTPPTYEDPIVTGTQYDYNYAQVSLLLNGDGTNGSTTFTDLSISPKTITNTGSVTVNTSVKKFGTGSIYFSGTNTLSAGSIVLGTNNFTIEFWFNQTSQMPYSHLFTATSAYGTTNGLRVTTGGLNLTVYSASTTLIQPAVAISNGSWYHFALVRNGTTLTLYQNGVSLGSTTTSISFVSDTFMIGGDTTYPYNGYIDDFRVTNGIARYTQNFTPPTAPLPTSGGY
jgi:hypothetical protein